MKEQLDFKLTEFKNRCVVHEKYRIRSVNKRFFRIMKLTSLILLISCMHLSASSLAQKVNLKVQNGSLKEVFKELNKQTGYFFIYDKDVLKNAKPVNVSLSDVSLENALTIIFNSQPLRYVLDKNTLIISEGSKRVESQQENIIISGRVYDTNVPPNALADVSVFVKGTSLGTKTDFQGHFSISVPKGSTLLFSMTGFQPVERIFQKEEQNVSLSLETEVSALDEVVVVGMNIRQTKRSVTGAMSTIETKELKQSPVANLNNALAGRVPGLMTVQASGQPGSDAAAMYIRGVSTYGSNKSPLIVIDGLPRSEGSFSQIDPNEVESVSILKDASSSALYGIQGANGVIVVTTKRGKQDQQPAIDFTNQTGILQATRSPQLASTYEYASKWERIYSDNSGFSTPFNDDVLDRLKDGSADPYLYPNINWYDEILKPISPQQQNNINVSGSSNIVRYFVSGSYLHQGTILKHQDTFFNNYGKKSGFNRYNFRSNVDIKANSSLTVQVDLAGRLEKRTGPSSGFEDIFNTLRWVAPFSMPVFNPNGTLGMGSAVQVPYWKNLYGAVTQAGYYENSTNAMYGTISATHKLDFLVPGLSAQGFFSFENNNYSNTARTQNFNAYNYKGLDLDGNPVYSQHAIESTLSTGGSNSIDRSNYLDFRLIYQKQISDHSITVQILGNRTLRTINQELPYAYQGVSARVGYGYLNRYFAESNLGYNGSENFPSDRRYGFFPSGSIAWIASDESFFQGVNWLKYLKVRGSYGVAGNDKIGGQRWLYLTDFAPGGGYSFGVNPSGRPGYNESRVGNPYVTWERSKKSNVGFETSLFHQDLISLSLDLFYEKRTNILTAPGTVPTYLGISNLSPLNSGVVENRGLDGEFTVRKNWSDWAFFSTVQFTYAKNKVLENDQPTPAFPYQDLRGYPVGYQLGYRSLGLFRDVDDIRTSPKQTFDNITIPGDVKYEDVSGNGTIGPEDRMPIRMFNVPTWTGGFSLGVTYKGLDVSVLMNGAFGGTAVFKPKTNDQRTIAKLWTEKNKDARHPVPKEGLNNSMSATDFWLQSTDYIKFRNAEIGYVLPPIINGVKYARIFVNGQNLAIWDKLWVKDRDPETTADAMVYPIQRVFNFGVNIRL